jgi:hypothetical protein
VKKRKQWTSEVYDHFEPAVIARDEDSEKMYRKGVLLFCFVCKM